MRGIGRRTGMTGLAGMCSALALAGAMPALAQPLTVQLREQPAESLPAMDDADYQWIDDADALLDAIGDAPPDFTFAYDRNDIWGWRTGTGHEIYAEPLGGGAIRYYYFEPGSREPFLVQDEDFAFGYRPGGRMIVVYDADGRLLSRSEGDREASLADWLYRRGRAIHASAQNDREWDSIDAGYWAEQVPIIVDLRRRWSSGRDRHPGWRRWHGRTGATKWRAPLAGERQRRWSDSDRFRRWQRDGFRGTPPRFNDGGSRPVPGVRPPRPGGRPDGVRPSRPDRPDGVRPPRPDRPEGVRPPRPDRPEGTRPDRPDRPGWVRPRPPVDGTQPGTQPPAGAERPQRPDRPNRPGWGRPRPPAGDAGTPPPQTAPANPERPRPEPRPRWRPDGATPPAAAPSQPPRARPDRPNFTRPPGFAPTERPHASAPPRAQPAERPQPTPRPAPPVRVAPPPPPTPSPTPPPQPRVVERTVEQPQ